MKMNKRGLGKMMEVLVTIIAAVLLLLVVISIFFPHIWNIGDLLRQQQNLTVGDPDLDGVLGFSDDCPCTYGEIEFNGCPQEYTTAQKQADKQKYNSDTGCEVIKTTEGEEVKEKKEEETFMHYRSLELFADVDYRFLDLFADDDNGNREQGEIRLACPGWVGYDCHSEDNDCDGKFSSQPSTRGCWIMASEDNNLGNNCGQYKLDEETVISSSSYTNLDSFVQDQSYVGDDVSKNLFNWDWKSPARVGSLVCKDGFWFGCKQGGDGKSLEVNGKKFTCRNNEWVK